MFNWIEEFTPDNKPLEIIEHPHKPFRINKIEIDVTLNSMTYHLKT